MYHLASMSYSYSNEMEVAPSSVVVRPGFLESQRQSIKLPIAFLMGGVLGLSTPGFDLAPIAWFGLVPLLILTRACRHPIEAALTGLAFGTGYYAVALSFFLGLLPLDWLGINSLLSYQVVLITWVVESLHCALLIGLFSLLVFCLPLRAGFLANHRRPFYPYLLAIPAIWVFIAWVIAPSPLFLGTPLSQLAYTQAKNTQLIQIASISGSGAIDFLIVLINCAITGVIIELSPFVRKLGERTDRLNTEVGAIADLVLATLLVFCVCSWGGMQMAHIEESVRPERATRLNPQTPPVPVAVLQGNVSIEQERFKTMPPEEFSGRYTELAANNGASIMVLPEGVVTSSQMGPGGLMSKMSSISAKERKEIILGAVQPMADGYVNCAKLLSPFHYKENTYVKQRLVPFGESIPVNLLYQKIPEELRNRIPASKEQFLAAKKAQLIHSGWGKIGVAICNEAIYPQLVSEQVRQGASLIVVLANLGWFHNSSLNKQFLACATLRAVENRRFVILSTNSGVSSVIDPCGVVVSKSLALKRGILLDTVQFIYSKTPFSRLRWL
ncbi:MAG: apolipoprotein N-acyltransferase [Cyanobacteria bacterium SZAS TMP-1]|nr:apolipoprotein N-acyltransferase [Cyanobacteria bacterium SZAS TMP-1]